MASTVNALFETSKKGRRKSRRRPGKLYRALAAVFRGSLVLLLGASGVVAAGYLYVVLSYGEHLERPYPELPERSLVFDADGRQVAEFGAAESRETVSREDLGEHLPRAVVAVEDRRFHEHAGVDPAGVSRAAWHDLKALEFQQGGSTLTEQLMKNLFVPEEERDETSPGRRFAQAALAISYEQEHSKQEVMTSYLNTVYFGRGAYGAEVAAERYFGKPARELDLPEAAALAGFLRAPSSYDPASEEGIRDAQERRDEVLGMMEEQGVISTPERRAAEEEPFEVTPESFTADPDHDPFLEKVRREVEEQLGEGALDRGGLRIRTTLDAELQSEAVASSAEVLPEGGPAGAVVSIEPATGAVRAAVGERDGFNLALDARRQPGSVFKPVVLAAALRQYVSPETTYLSQELDLEFEGREYTIENYDSVERGEITVDQAMAESDNAVFVQLALDLGLESVAETAADLGVTPEVEPVPSTAIGGLGEGVSALHMSSAYATLASGGVYREPYAVERIDGESFGERDRLYEHREEGRRVMTENQAAAATEVLRGVVESGTTSTFRELDEDLGRPSAGKTGTTDDFADAWYVGYTPLLSTAVWVGHPEGRRPMRDVAGIPEVNGETLPLDLWARFMSPASSGEPVLDFPEADAGEFVPLERGYARDDRSAVSSVPDGRETGRSDS